MGHDHEHRHHPTIARATAPPERGRASRTTMAVLARDFLDRLPEAQRAIACRPFDDNERFNWHYVPRERAGLPVRQMTEEGRLVLHALMREALGEVGYRKAAGVFEIERVLGLIEGRPHYRDPENYSLTLFGQPGAGTWGWRLEGHHLSLNFTACDEQVMAILPAFWGSNPAQVPDGYPLAGHRPLGRETDLAFALVRGLGEDERRRATVWQTSLGDIVSGPGREQHIRTPEGLPLSAMDEGARALVLELVETYAGNFSDELAGRELERLREAGLERLHFAWGGPLEDGFAHYWRLHGPVSLIEFDNTQNDANHIHTVWHDLTRDFGRDLLGEHYAHGHRHEA